jgi:hypothetical protein
MLTLTQGLAFPTPGPSFGLLDLQGRALRYDHGVWRWTTLQLRGTFVLAPIWGLALSSPTQGWGLGLHSVSGNEQEAVLLSYDASSWSVVRQQS